MLTPQRPIPPSLDLRDMLRQHIIARSLSAMAEAANRRRASLASRDVAGYRAAIEAAVRGFYGDLPVGPNAEKVAATEVSRFEKAGYRLENILFDSFPGWQVNATVYVPLDFAPPFPAVVIPVGHSGKQFANYQLPAQFFARSGYLAVLFDPPGQSSEKRPGNDHFTDGVRSYLVGETSSQYFVADALRCIDYLEARPDVDLGRGVAMTGVSGGGTTTTLATLLDDRITVAGPSCCLTPLADLDIMQCYAGCPETHMWRRYAEGVDEVDLLCAAAPTPMLLMAGEFDEVFRIADTRRLAEEVAGFYAQAGAQERFAFFVDQAGHGYTLEQARRFVSFMNRWLLGAPGRPLTDLPDAAFAPDPYDELRCFPRLEVNMRTLALDRAAALEAARTEEPSRDGARVRAGAAAIAGVDKPVGRPEAVEGSPFPVWTHHWLQVLLRPEPGIELPATLLLPQAGMRSAVLHLDDDGRNRALYRHGLLARALRFLERDQPGLAALAVDLRGWGDSAPAVYPYEMAAWGGLDRYAAYATAALGDPVMSMRTRDALAALAYLRSRPEVDAHAIVLTGSGLGGVVALFAAAIDGAVAGVITWDALLSFRALLEEEAYAWPADAFIPHVLRHFDLPELAASLACPVRILNPLDGCRRQPPEQMLADLNRRSGRAIYATVVGDASIAAEIMERCDG
jgi:dienelactone hydrolase